ncbi:hypothetical protein HG530_010797 [Fusarium avenaceum]|nr:hypothetical protein HG530_010797 [Fusarium avenaceum]
MPFSASSCPVPTSSPDALKFCANRTASEAANMLFFPTSVMTLIKAVKFSSLWRIPDVKKSVKKYEAAMNVANETSGLRNLVLRSVTSATVIIICRADSFTRELMCGSAAMSICDRAMAERWIQIMAVQGQRGESICHTFVELLKLFPIIVIFILLDSS